MPRADRQGEFYPDCEEMSTVFVQRFQRGMKAADWQDTPSAFFYAFSDVMGEFADLNLSP